MLNGAGEGNRTLVSGLGSPRSTIEPHPLPATGALFVTAFLPRRNCPVSPLEANDFFELADTLFNGGSRDLRRAAQTETLAAKRSHHAAVNHPPFEVRLNRTVAARQITDQTADKRLRRAS